MKRSILMSCLVLSNVGFGIAGAHKLTYGRSTEGNRLLGATGIVRMFNGSVTQETYSNGQTKLRIRPDAQTAECSAVFIKRPAWFLTSAVCFADKSGHLDQYRRFAKVFVNGKGYMVDSRSIQIHKKFKAALAENDLAVFSIAEVDRETFSRSHTPIPVIPANAPLIPGQKFQFVGYGATSEKGGDFGVPYSKEFVEHYPDPDPGADGRERLLIRPTQQLITFKTKDASKGVNCIGDSGMGGFVKFLDSSERETLYLATTVIGKLGPNGRLGRPCEDISRYSIGIDLRFVHGWLNEIEGVFKKAKDQEKEILDHVAKVLKPVSNNVPNFAWYSSPIPGIKKFLDSVKHLPANKQYPHIAKKMSQLGAQFDALSMLRPTGNVKIQSKLYPTQFADPWKPSYSDWILAYQKSGSSNTFYNQRSTKAVGNFFFRNISSETLKFSSVDVYDAYGNRIHEINTKFEIQPGQQFYFWAQKGVAKGVSRVRFYGNTIPRNGFQVHFVPAQSVSFYTDGYNDFEVKSPRAVVLKNGNAKKWVGRVSLVNKGNSPAKIEGIRHWEADKYGSRESKDYVFPYKDFHLNPSSITYDWNRGSLGYWRMHSGAVFISQGEKFSLYSNYLTEREALNSWSRNSSSGYSGNSYSGNYRSNSNYNSGRSYRGGTTIHSGQTYRYNGGSITVYGGSVTITHGR